ncbi:MAG: hypothetical protein JSS20_19215, partial [Proteobacteria bacterium]|nr:hypothetical protein [Pseudomonadota bacterium]
KRIGTKKAAEYYLDLGSDPAPKISNAGEIALPMIFQIPKQEGSFDLLVRFKASRRGKSISLTPFVVTFAKSNR